MPDPFDKLTAYFTSPTYLRRGKWDHYCPSCHAWIRWALTFCYDCGELRRSNPRWDG